MLVMVQASLSQGIVRSALTCGAISTIGDILAQAVTRRQPGSDIISEVKARPSLAQRWDPKLQLFEASLQLCLKDFMTIRCIYHMAHNGALPSTQQARIRASLDPCGSTFISASAGPCHEENHMSICG